MQFGVQEEEVFGGTDETVGLGAASALINTGKVRVQKKEVCIFFLVKCAPPELMTFYCKIRVCCREDDGDFIGSFRFDVIVLERHKRFESKLQSRHFCLFKIV